MSIDIKTFKPSSTVLVVTTMLHMPELEEIKAELTEHYGNEYTMPSHISFLIMPFNLKAQKDIEKPLDKYFHALKSFTLKIKQVGFEANRKFFYLTVEPEKDCTEIHYDLLEVCNPYRSNLIREKDYKRLQADSKFFKQEELERIKQYGYSRSGKGYEVHITVGNIVKHLSDNDLNVIRANIKNKLNALVGIKIHISKISARIAKEAISATETDIYWEKKYPLK